jgi:gamma-glutamyltranspeptidase/glutathione hydrolase
MWAHILIESMRQAAVDRPEVLHADANSEELLADARLQPRAANVSKASVARLDERFTTGGTTHLCVRDSEGMGVSLTQSNGMSFGSRLVVGETGIWLQNRGFAFSLEPGHPAEYGPARRPPHTLSPLMITDGDGRLRALLGTRGGDSQPQILLQLVARLVHAGQDAAEALAAGRWVLRGDADETSFDTWGFHGSVRVALEGQVPSGWDVALSALGHRVESEPSFSHAFGHAQVVLVGDDGLSGAADPRALAEQVAGY